MSIIETEEYRQISELFGDENTGKEYWEKRIQASKPKLPDENLGDLIDVSYPPKSISNVSEQRNKDMFWGKTSRLPCILSGSTPDNPLAPFCTAPRSKDDRLCVPSYGLKVNQRPLPDWFQVYHREVSITRVLAQFR